MPAYAILNIDIHDAIVMEEYKKLGPTTVQAHEGKFIVRGGEATVLEGAWNPKRLVIIEFPTVEKAKEWWHSSAYQHAKTIRERAANTDLIIVDGV